MYSCWTCTDESPGKTAEQMDMPSGMWTHVHRRNHALIGYIRMRVVFQLITSKLLEGVAFCIIVLYLLVWCVLLPVCHVLKQEKKCQWCHRVAMVDFLLEQHYDQT